MTNGPYNEDQFEGQDLAPEVGAPLTFQFEGHPKGLTETQRQLMQTYFDEQIRDNFTQFVNVAPQPLQPLRQLIIAYAPIVVCDSFEKFINQFYPAVPDSDESSQQNQFFRQLLSSFNRLCNNNIDIDHPLYTTIFDPRFSPTKQSSPTKRNLVTCFFKNRIKEHFHFSENDQFVSQALAWLKESGAQFNQSPPISMDKDCSAKRQLSFGY